MSRSKKRTPIGGITGARSEKQDKRLYNRRYRHVCKQVLHVYPESEVLLICGNTVIRGAWIKTGRFGLIRRSIRKGCGNKSGDRIVITPHLTTHSTGAQIESISSYLSLSQIGFIRRARLIRALGAS